MTDVWVCWKTNICLKLGWLKWLIGHKSDQSELDALVPVITQDVWVKKFCEHSLANPTVAYCMDELLKFLKQTGLRTHSFIESVRSCHQNGAHTHMKILRVFHMLHVNTFIIIHFAVFLESYYHHHNAGCTCVCPLGVFFNAMFSFLWSWICF